MKTLYEKYGTNETKIPFVIGQKISIYIKKNHPDLIHSFKDVSFQSVHFKIKPIHSQETTRDIILKQWMNHSKKKRTTLGKPDYFAIFILLISKEDVTSYQDAINSCDRIHPPSYEYKDYHFYKCACSQDIQHVCKFTNNDTNITIVVGSCCVNKTKITGLEDAKDLIKKKKKEHIEKRVNAFRQEIKNSKSIVDIDNVIEKIKYEKPPKKAELSQMAFEKKQEIKNNRND